MKPPVPMQLTQITQTPNPPSQGHLPPLDTLESPVLTLHPSKTAKHKCRKMYIHIQQPFDKAESNRNKNESYSQMKVR